MGIPTVGVPAVGYQKRLQELKEKLDSVVRGSSSTPLASQLSSNVIDGLVYFNMIQYSCIRV